MLEFQKGFSTENGFIKEGAEVKVVTVQGIVLEGILMHSAKKKMGVQLSGELEIRMFELEVISTIELI